MYSNSLSYSFPSHTFFYLQSGSHSVAPVHMCLLSHYDLIANLLVTLLITTLPRPSASCSLLMVSLPSFLMVLLLLLFVLGPLAGIRSPAFLSLLPSHRLNNLFIDQSEMMKNNFYITLRLEMLEARAILWPLDRCLGIQISI